MQAVAFLPSVEVTDSDVIFVGYGVVASEYHWDDYKGVDVRGKTIIMLGERSARGRSQRPDQTR